MVANKKEKKERADAICTQPGTTAKFINEIWSRGIAKGRYQWALMQLDRPMTNQINETYDVVLSDTCKLGWYLVRFQAGKKWRPGHKHSQVKAEQFTKMCF